MTTQASAPVFDSATPGSTQHPRKSHKARRLPSDKALWREGARAKSRGGFRFFHVPQLVLVWWCYRQGLIGLASLRAWFAAGELISRRCTLEEGRKPNFSYAELSGLLGGGETSARRAIRELEQVGLLRWSKDSIEFATSPEQVTADELGEYWEMLALIPNNRRRVPIPRPVIRLMAGGARRSLIATLLGHLLRGMFYRHGKISPNGASKASWIAGVFSVDERSVRRSRSHLIGLGVLEQTETPQRVMNRWGCWYRWNLDWSRATDISELKESMPQTVDNSTVGEGGSESKLPAPQAENGSKLSSPKRNRELPTGSKNQKPAFSRRSGVCIENQRNSLRPRISNIVQADLDQTPRLLELFAEATRIGLIEGSDAARLRFVAAAEHARTIGTRNPSGLFAFLVRSKKWHYATESDDESAHRRLKRHFYGDQTTRTGANDPLESSTPLSEDARVVKALTESFIRRRIAEDPLACLQRERPGWTLERWTRASAELNSSKLAEVGVGVGGLLD